MATLDQSWTTQNVLRGCANSTVTLYRAQQFTVGVAGIISQVDLYIDRTGTGGNNYTLSIWSDDGDDLPDTAVSDETTIVSSEVLSTELSWISYPITNGPNASVGQKYWIVIYRSASDGANYCRCGADNAGGYAGGIQIVGGSGPTWYDDSTYDINFKEYYGVTASTSKNLLLLGVG